MPTTQTTDFRIYVACLSAYNSGILHGAWIDVVEDVEEVQAHIQTMLNKSPMEDAEEYAIHDYEAPVKIEEGSDIETLCKMVELMEKHGQAILAYVEYIGADLDDVEDAFQDNYQGEHRTEQEYAEQLIDDCYDLEKSMGNLSFYFDYEAFTRDLFISDYFSITTPDGNVWVFSN